VPALPEVNSESGLRSNTPLQAPSEGNSIDQNREALEGSVPSFVDFDPNNFLELEPNVPITQPIGPIDNYDQNT